ncbi:NADH-quinone oxidoreductase subunit A [Candidatus Scalindua japonica]|nr:NADH-quinone oxidoreductase subunit A [Candidatus Scalindua japonica]
MLVSYIPILILLLVVMGFAISNIIISAAVGRQKPSAEKLSTYECGIEPTGTARERFSVKFYLIAMMFVVFDIEVVFLYPWAVAFKSLKLFGLIEMGIFILILLFCYVYIWKRGALEWE